MDDWSINELEMIEYKRQVVCKTFPAQKSIPVEIE